MLTQGKLINTGPD